MPTERLSMRRIRELLRLKYENGLSSRLIAASLGISKGAVGVYLNRAKAAQLTWPLPEAMSDTALERLLFPGQVSARTDRGPVPDWAHIDRELRRPGVTRALLWVEYRENHPNGYSYTWFCTSYEAFKQRVSPTMR